MCTWKILSFDLLGKTLSTELSLQPSPRVHVFGYLCLLRPLGYKLRIPMAVLHRSISSNLGGVGSVRKHPIEMYDSMSIFLLDFKYSSSN